MVQHPVSVDSPPFCVIRCGNDGMYLPGDEAAASERLRNRPKNHIEFNQTQSPSNAKSFRPHKQQAIKALRKLKYGEELS